MAPASPVYAVYNDANEGRPKNLDELLFETCPVLALVKDENGEIDVVGLTVETWGLVVPKEENFLGYVSSKDQAIGEFISP